MEINSAPAIELKKHLHVCSDRRDKREKKKKRKKRMLLQTVLKDDSTAINPVLV